MNGTRSVDHEVAASIGGGSKSVQPVEGLAVPARDAGSLVRVVAMPGATWTQGCVTDWVLLLGHEPG
jgi:hypothetical protein